MDKLEVWPKTEEELNTLLSSKKNTRTFHPLYSTYWNMRGRCYNKNVECYPRYGGKGIRVCEKLVIIIKRFLEKESENVEPLQVFPVMH